MSTILYSINKAVGLKWIGVKTKIIKPILYDNIENIIETFECIIKNGEPFYIRGKQWHWEEIIKQQAEIMEYLPKRIKSVIETFNNKYKAIIGTEYVGIYTYKINGEDPIVYKKICLLLENIKRIKIFLTKCMNSSYYYKIGSRFYKDC